MCSSRDIHAIIAYCSVCLLLMLPEAGQMEELVGVSLCHHCLGRKHTEMSGELWVSAFVMFSMFRKYSKAAEVLLCLCLHTEGKVCTRTMS